MRADVYGILYDLTVVLMLSLRSVLLQGLKRLWKLEGGSDCAGPARPLDQHQEHGIVFWTMAAYELL